MLLRFTKILLLSLIALPAFAQKGLRVTVLEQKTQQPVQLATISIYSLPNHTLQMTSYTDINGIIVVSPQTYPCVIEVTAVGHESYTRSFNAAPINTQILVLLQANVSELDEVVVTGVNQPVKMKNALSNYRVISRAEIQSRGAVTLDQALKTQLNINISKDDILGSGIQMQGMSGNKVKILIDGMPVNGREGGNINLGQINMNNVERIEIVQGPMSVVYGTDALGGVVNIITRKEKKPFEIQLGTFYETLGNYNVDGMITYKLKKHHQFTLNAGRNYFEGYKNVDRYTNYNNLDSILTKRVYQFKPNEQYFGNFAYSYTSDSNFHLNFNSDFLKETVTNRGGLVVWTPAQASANDEYYTTLRSMNRLSMDGKLGKTGHWQNQMAYAHYLHKRRSVTKNMVTLQETPQDPLQQDTTTFDDITLRGAYNNKLNIISYTAGYDVNLQFANSNKIPGGDRAIQDYAIYANASVPVFKDKLVAQLGGRGAYNSSYHAPVTPSVNILYTPTSKFQFRASYTQGFRSPALKEMYLSFVDANHNLKGNPDLKAEKSDNFQLSGSYQVWEEGRNYLQFIVTGYYNDVYNGIVLVNIDPTNPSSIDYQYRNFDHMENAIGNFQADGQLNNFHFQAGYAYTYTLGRTGIFSAYGASEVTATLQYAFRKPALNVNLMYKYNGPRPMITPDITGAPLFDGHAAGYQICDGSIEKKFFNNRLQFIAGVKNIFDVRSLTITGASVSTQGAHGVSGNPGNFLPRSFFTSLRLTLN